MIIRMTMRAFRARIGRIEEPVLVNEGIWFPKSTPRLERIADGQDPCRENGGGGPITKADQARGRTRR